MSNVTMHMESLNKAKADKTYDISKERKSPVGSVCLGLNLWSLRNWWSTLNLSSGQVV